MSMSNDETNVIRDTCVIRVSGAPSDLADLLGYCAKHPGWGRLKLETIHTHAEGTETSTTIVYQARKDAPIDPRRSRKFQKLNYPTGEAWHRSAQRTRSNALRVMPIIRLVSRKYPDGVTPTQAITVALAHLELTPKERHLALSNLVKHKRLIRPRPRHYAIGPKDVS